MSERDREAVHHEARDRRELRRDLDELAESIRAIDWAAVPTLGPDEAGAAIRRLEAARDAIDGGDLR